MTTALRPQPPPLVRAESLVRRRAAGIRGGWPLSLLVTAIIVFLFFPLIVVVGVSLDSSTAFHFPPHTLSLRWFDHVISDPGFRHAFVTSIKISLIVSLLASITGTAFAVAATRRNEGRFRFTHGLAMAPVLLPGIFIGVALFTMFTVVGIQMSMRTAVLGQLLYVVPYVILIADARLREFDLSLEEASRNLGYSRAATFAFVTVPMILPSVMAAFILAFAISFDEFFITFFVIGQGVTLPIYIFSRLRIGFDPGANAVATILLLVPLLVVGTAALGSYLWRATRGR